LCAREFQGINRMQRKGEGKINNDFPKSS
jgi:hypothetical protein